MKTELKKRDDGSLRIRTINEKKSKTQQHYRDKVNINNIVKKYAQTGMMNQMLKENSRDGVFGDFTHPSLQDYSKVLNQVESARKDFLKIPSETRSRFDNDPEKLIKFLADPKNIEESIKLGLRVKAGVVDGGKKTATALDDKTPKT